VTMHDTGPCPPTSSVMGIMGVHDKTLALALRGPATAVQMGPALALSAGKRHVWSGFSPSVEEVAMEGADLEPPAAADAHHSLPCCGACQVAVELC